jgi:hypothetical protein
MTQLVQPDALKACWDPLVSIVEPILVPHQLPLEL